MLVGVTACGSDADPATTSSAAPPALVAAADWPGYAPDLGNSMVNPTEEVLSPATVGGLHEVWRIAAPGGVTGTPAVVDGVVYFGDWAGWARAVSAVDGSIVWEQKVTEDRITASLLVTGDIVYVPTFGAELVALDRSTGATLWSAPVDARPDTRVFSSPVLADGVILLGVAKLPPGDYHLGVVALDAADGHEHWRWYSDTGRGDTGWAVAVWSSAAVDLDRRMVYIGTGNTNWRDGAARLPDSPYANGVAALALDSGELAWMYRLVVDDSADLDVGASPNLFTVGGRDVVGVGGKSGEYAVLDRETGKEIWKAQLSKGSPAGGVQGTAAVADGRIYVASNDGLFGDTLLLCLDAADGSVVWRRRLPSPHLAAVALANGVVYATTSGVGTSGGGVLYAVAADDGAVLWSSGLPTQAAGAPSVAAGTVFVGAGFGLPPAMLLDPEGALVAYSAG